MLRQRGYFLLLVCLLCNATLGCSSSVTPVSGTANSKISQGRPDVQQTTVDSQTVEPQTTVLKVGMDLQEALSALESQDIAVKLIYLSVSTPEGFYTTDYYEIRSTKSKILFLIYAGSRRQEDSQKILSLEWHKSWQNDSKMRFGENVEKSESVSLKELKDYQKLGTGPEFIELE